MFSHMLHALRVTWDRRHIEGSWAALALGLMAFVVAPAQAGQTSAPFSVTATLTPAPVSIVSDTTSVVVCGTSPASGTSGCGVFPVAPAIVSPVVVAPIAPPSVVVPTASQGSGGTLPTGPFVSSLPASPIGATVIPSDTSSATPAVAVPILPVASATTQQITVLQLQFTPSPQFGPNSPFGPRSQPGTSSQSTPGTPSELGTQGPLAEGTRPAPGSESTGEQSVNSVVRVASGSVQSTSNVLGTTAETRQVRDATSSYTEMLVGW